MINTADKILCDVPCSGLGIIGRKPEIKWNRAEDNDLPKIQRQILDNASKYLKINGEIVYSTCTIEKEENEAVTDSFTADNENFEKVFEKTFYPHIDNTDGFYICKMKRIKYMIDLKDFEYDELIEYLTSVGEKKFRAEQIFSWLHKGVENYDEMTNLSKATRNKLEKVTYHSTLNIRENYVSKIAGTVK